MSDGQQPGYNPNAVGATQQQQGKGGALFGLFQDTNGFFPDTQGWAAGKIGASFAQSKGNDAFSALAQNLGFNPEAKFVSDVQSIAEGVQAPQGAHAIYGEAMQPAGGHGAHIDHRMVYGETMSNHIADFRSVYGIPNPTSSDGSSSSGGGWGGDFRSSAMSAAMPIYQAGSMGGHMSFAELGYLTPPSTGKGKERGIGAGMGM